MLLESLLADLFPLLKIPSVKQAPKDGAPFGEPIKDALTYVLSLAKSKGFETYNYQNYIGEVVFGKGEPFAVLCHLDVVPAGSLALWKTPPFEPTIIDDKLFCRGVLDDKSSAISVLTALSMLKEEGLKPKREIRLILGCDEESGWACVEHYKTIKELPSEGFSPDADFPVVYAEKGILHIKYSVKKLKPFKIWGGVKANVVCDRAEVEALGNFDLEKYKLKRENEKIVSFGVSAHGSTPEKGVNALDKLFLFLEDNGFIEKGAHDNFFVSRKGVKTIFDQTGTLTFSPNVVEDGKESFSVIVDVRYPATKEKQEILTSLEKIGAFEILSFQAPLFNDKNGTLVKSLSSAFEKVTGKTLEPIAIGGGTYARALKNGVAFGPAMGDEGNTVHQTNEFLTLTTLEQMTKIYYEALKTLCF